MILGYLFFLIIFILPFPATAGVIINEIAWMGTLPKEGESTSAAANNEWIELFNSGGESISLEGWKIVSEDGMPDISLLGTIAANSFYLLERANDDVVPFITADLVYSYKTNALSNSGERLFLKNFNGVIIDEIDASSGWQAGDNTTKETMQWNGSSWITASPTPGAKNFGVKDNESSGGENTQENQSGFSEEKPQNGPLSPVIIPKIKAYAGEDKTAVAGSNVYFFGAATGLKNEPLEEARFLWNFGDGETKEGASVSHIFKMPGKYLSGLHISSGIYAASDYLEVEVLPNKLEISDVLEGEDGYIGLKNLSEVAIDIGGWILEDGGLHKFVIPSKTKVADGAEISLANIVTKLLLGDNTHPIILKYPNSKTAIVYNPAQKNEVSVIKTNFQNSVPEKTENKKIAAANNYHSKIVYSHPVKNAEQIIERESPLQEESLNTPQESEKEFAQISKTISSTKIMFAAALVLSLAGAAGIFFLRF